MCGITGFYSTQKLREHKRFHAIAKAMSDVLTLRGPDSAGIWQGKDLPIVLAHRRLAIVDLSAEGHQPMESSSGRYVLTYNGEIYNFLALRKALEQSGIVFRGRSDTEVILAGVEVWGLNLTLQKMHGMFALALWDRKEKQLHLIRDRLGKKPLYVGWAGKMLVFGSELKALAAHPDFKADINRDSLALYLRYGYVPAPHCIYKNIWQLPAGFRLALDVSALRPGENLEARMEPYWHHLRVLEEARAKATPRTEGQILKEFEALLSLCVKERMISDVPLGAFLSGGIDSSLIVALMQKESPTSVKTYSIGFDEAGFDEAGFAKKIAAHLGTDHHELYLRPEDARDVIPELPQIYDEPFADISQIPTYLVSKFARRDVTVALSGDGGDEMLGGYNRHIVTPAIIRKMKLLPLPVRKLMAKLIKSVPIKTLDLANFDQLKRGEHLHKIAEILPLSSQQEIYRALVSQWQSPLELLARDRAQEPQTLLERAEWKPSGLSFAEEMMYDDALTYLPGDILTKVDRASMAVSLEARAPLLDARLYEYVWSLPEHVKIRNGQGKWLLREVLKRHVPAALFERPKQGFSIPVSDWLRGPLREWADELLRSERLVQEGFLNAPLVHKAWEDHQKGAGNYGTRLWTILMFQTWLERWG